MKQHLIEPNVSSVCLVEIHSENCIVRWFHLCLNIIECTWTDWDDCNAIRQYNLGGSLLYMSSLVDKKAFIQCMTVLQKACGKCTFSFHSIF